MFKYLIVLLALVIIGDQICVLLADRTLRNTPQFFEEIVAKANLSQAVPSDNYFYQSCEFHQVKLIYKAKTCFSRNGGTNPSRYGDERELLSLFYWPPLSKVFSIFSGYYYEEACCNEMLMYVSRDNKIIEDFRNDEL